MFYNLAAEQARKGKTDSEISEVLGIARETYHRKKQKQSFTFSEIKALCIYFGASFDYLFATDEKQGGEGMQFALKNNDGIECHFDKAERELIYNALRHYSAYGKEDSYITDNIGTICEILNVLHLPEFDTIRK